MRPGLWVPAQPQKRHDLSRARIQIERQVDGADQKRRRAILAEPDGLRRHLVHRQTPYRTENGASRLADAALKRTVPNDQAGVKNGIGGPSPSVWMNFSVTSMPIFTSLKSMSTMLVIIFGPSASST